jgi:hypothetical protein
MVVVVVMMMMIEKNSHNVYEPGFRRWISDGIQAETNDPQMEG